MDQYWEREIRKQEGRLQTLSERINELARRVSALESVSPAVPPASESTCAPTTTGETPPTDRATGQDLRPILTGMSEDPIGALCNDLLSLRRFDHLMPEIVAVVRAAAELERLHTGQITSEWSTAYARLRGTVDALRAKLREVRNA